VLRAYSCGDCGTVFADVTPPEQCDDCGNGRFERVAARRDGAAAFFAGTLGR
jgi:rubredoxin